MAGRSPVVAPLLPSTRACEFFQLPALVGAALLQDVVFGSNRSQNNLFEGIEVNNANMEAPVLQNSMVNKIVW